MSQHGDERRQELRVKSLHEPVSHYVDAVRWGDLSFVSGSRRSTKT